MRRLITFILILASVSLVSLGVAVRWGGQWLRAPLATITTTTTFEVPRGASLRSVAGMLREQQILDRPQLWLMWARLTQGGAVLKAGEYEIKPGTTPQQLFKLLSSGAVLLHSVTFIEGSTFADIRKLLRAQRTIRQELAERSDEEVMSALGEPGIHPEGQFFPDTYRFASNTSDRELLGIAHRRMKTELDAAWRTRAPDLPLASAYEALILASIIEKETALERERPLIGGVFIGRLRRGMLLQTDPTVIYGIGATYDGDIRDADLQRDNPYNTYKRTGLPPTPIALPGAAALRAATQPQISGALYFVATGDPDGSHHFSVTYAEHQAALQRYLSKYRRANSER